MSKPKFLAFAILIGFGLFEAAPARAMRCELVYLGGPGDPSKWFCEGEPFVSTPVSFWRSPGMGMSWPNNGSHRPIAWVVCEYGFYNGQRHVTWQTFFQGGDGVWYPYPLDRCDFYCFSTKA